ALETGRGLTLFAITEHRTVADRLLAAERTDLAERWRAATRDAEADQVPIELRRAALDVFNRPARPARTAAGAARAADAGPRRPRVPGARRPRHRRRGDRPGARR